MRLLFLPHLCVYPSLVLPDPDLFRTQMIPIKYPFYLPLHVFFSHTASEGGKNNSDKKP